MAQTHGSTQVPYQNETIKLIERLTGLPDQLEIISIVSNRKGWRTEDPVSYLNFSKLAREVCRHPFIISHFQIRKLTPLSFRNKKSGTLRRILTPIVGNKIGYESSRKSDQELGQQLKKVLMAHRFLIFIDKSWYNTRKWDDWKRYFPDNGNGSRIVFCNLSYSQTHGSTEDPFHDDTTKDLFHDDTTEEPYHDETIKLIERLTGLPDQLEIISIVSNRKRWRTEEQTSYFNSRELASQVYDHPSIISHFQIRTLTSFPNQYQKSGLLLKHLSMIVVYPLTYESFGNSDEELGEQLKKVLMAHRFLIFIDKSWYYTGDWDDLKRYFPDNGNGSRIVFCTLSHFEYDVSLDLLCQPQHQAFETCGGVRLYFVGDQEEEDEIISDDGSSSIAMSSSGTSVKEEMMVGYGDKVMTLVDQLTGLQKKQLEVIPIVGMPGLGKTTLARHVYDHPNVEYHFYIRAWTRVSQLYQMRDLLLGILSSIVELTDEICKMSAQKLLELLKKRLLGHRYLIVLDAMWDNRVWNDLQRSFPDNNNGSKIIFTSRLAEVTSHVQGNNVHYLRFLTRDESWKLLCQKVFQRKQCPQHLMEIGMQIAEKCKGLPLAIVVIAGILANEKTLTWWRLVAKSVSSYIVSNPELYMDTLALSYNHLPRHQGRIQDLS